MPEFRTISKEEWEQYPTKPTGKPNEWGDVMAALQAGEIVELNAADDKHLRGMRIGLGRRAKQRGMQLEYRSKDNTLAVQLREPMASPSSDIEMQEATEEAVEAASGRQVVAPAEEDVTEAESPTPAHPAQQRRGRKSAAAS